MHHAAGLGYTKPCSQPFMAVRRSGLFGFANNILNISLNAQAAGVEALYGRSIMGTFHGMWSVGGVIGGIVGAIIAPWGYRRWRTLW